MYLAATILDSFWIHNRKELSSFYQTTREVYESTCNYVSESLLLVHITADASHSSLELLDRRGGRAAYRHYFEDFLCYKRDYHEHATDTTHFGMDCHLLGH